MVLGVSAFLPTQHGLAVNAYKSLTNNKKPNVIVTVTNTLGAFVKLVYISVHSYIKWKQNVYVGALGRAAAARCIDTVPLCRVAESLACDVW